MLEEKGGQGWSQEKACVKFSQAEETESDFSQYAYIHTHVHIMYLQIAYYATSVHNAFSIIFTCQAFLRCVL